MWFSCGAASAVAAKLTLDQYGATHQVRLVNNPVIEEHEDNRRFLKDCEQWLGQEIELAINPKWPECSAAVVWEKERFMGGNFGAPCTRALKRRARQHWEKTNPVEHHVLGFTIDERKRYERFIETERANVIAPLIDAGLTKQDCMNIIQAAGIEPPLVYRLGFPNANCLGCVKASSPTYWNHLRETFPDVFAERARQSRESGFKLARVKGEWVYLDELDPQAKGRPLKSMTVECGIFCEEELEVTPEDQDACEV